MQRREFITLLGGAAATWPLAARAQQPEQMRRIGVLMNRAADDPEGQAGVAAFQQGLATIGLERRPQCADRHPLERIRCRSRSQIRGGIGRARAGRHPGRWHAERDGVATGHSHLADRVCGRLRSGRRRLRRQPGPAGRQHYRLYDFRIQFEREMAGTAQADRAERDARGRPSGSRQSRRDRSVRRHPGHGAVARGGGEARSAFATPARSNALSRPSPAPRMAA